MKGCLIAFGVMIISVSIIGWLGNLKAAPSITSTAAYATLHSPNGTVQMFDGTIASASVIRQFPNDTICAVLDGPTTATVAAGITMRFYRLSCDLTTGYVNERYVNP